MTGARVERRLAAIMAVDVAGFSRMMTEDERGTLAAVKWLHRDVFAPAVAEHQGRIVKLMGDGALVEFASVVDAVTCALEVQATLGEKAAQMPLPIELRVGINVGDIIIEGRDIYGDGVNLAARIQEVARPGGVALSGAAHDHARGKIAAEFSDGGAQALKNIDEPVRIFHWQGQSTQEQKTATGAIAQPALPDKPSIVVLPFDNMSGDAEQEHVADGVVEAITAALSRIRTFFVIARNTAFTYKGRATNVQEIGRELGVAYILEGSVQRAGGRVRITIQLIETTGGAHLWAEKYDGALDDLFELQDQITEQVAGAIQPSIRQAEIDRSRLKRPQDLGAYDYTMRAIRHVWMLEETEAATALDLLEKALEIDPDYPLALALAGWCWAQRSVYNWHPDLDEAKTQALSFAERAAHLSSDDPLILTVLGTVHTFARNFGAARVLLERAIALDPNSAWAMSRLGWLDVYAGDAQSAQDLFERAMRLSPLDPMNFNNHVGLASASLVFGDDAGAAALFERALRERPNAHWVHRNLAAALYGAGRIEEAKTSYQTLMNAYPGMTVTKFKQAMVFPPEVLDRIGTQLLALGVPE